jgi:HD superfamily phosphodiesterase
VAELAEFYGINPEDFNLLPESFDHQSKIHGIGHVYRVMYHCLRLGLALESSTEARLSFFAAYLHDLSRKHDGRCTEHGRWAAEEKLPLYKALLDHYRISDIEREHIRTAILYHSLPEELPASHASWKITAILKDADALDRIRLGEWDLNPKFLRFEKTHERIDIARKLFYLTHENPFTLFTEMLELGNGIELSGL